MQEIYFEDDTFEVSERVKEKQKTFLHQKPRMYTHGAAGCMSSVYVAHCRSSMPISTREVWYGNPSSCGGVVHFER